MQIQQNCSSFVTSVAGSGKEGRNCPGASSKGIQSVTGTACSVLTVKMENIFCVSHSFLGFLENLL